VETVPVVKWQRAAGERVVKAATRFPELFFVFVLGGEDPIDYTQRKALASGRDLHPLLKRISQIHITEEARHLAFARAFLRDRVPKLPAWKKQALSFVAPIILAVMARMMLDPPVALLQRYGADPDEVRAAYRNNEEHRATIGCSLSKVRALMRELEIG
jgi:hypothetical protein